MAAPPPLIDHGRMLVEVELQGELLLRSAARALPAAARHGVPGCPGLDLAGTVRHLGSVHRVATHWVRHGRPPERWQRGPLDDDLVGYARAGLTDLVAELARHDPAQRWDTWWPDDRTHGFWRRRMTHETTVHRVDVQAAAEGGAAVDPVADDVALDGVDEVLFLWFGYRLGQLGMSSPESGAVALSAGGRHWLAVFEQGRSYARRVGPAEVAAADARVSATPQLLYLWCWGRVPIQDLSSDGDDDAVAQLWALLRPATQ